MLHSKSNRITLYVSFVVTIALVVFALLRDNAETITLEQATQLLQNKEVKKVVVSKDYVYLKVNKHYYRIAASQVRPRMFIDYKVEVKSDNSALFYLLVFLLLLGAGSLLFRWMQKHNSFDMPLNKQNTLGSKSNPSLQTPIEAIKSDVTFDDIGGISDVKDELEEIIDFMQNPKRYKRFGVHMPRGVLLVGPPGVGKTMIAKAVAHEAGVPFFYQSGASFVQIYVGMGAKRVSELFAQAKANAPSIIFIDEIDAVGKKRDGQRNDEREATLNQLLTEMDGFEGSSGVIVIAATNKIDVLDSALLRAGRFDRRVFVELPTKSEREHILSKYLRKVPHQLDVKVVANMTVGFNGASLAALVNEAALLALRQKVDIVTIEHFHSVKDKVMFGKKKLQLLSDKQKYYQITYQSAKVVVATYFDLVFEKLMLSNEKLTPASSTPMIQYEIESRIKMLLAGIVACDMNFNEHTSSVKGDLDEVKELISKMIYDYGMGKSLIASEDEEEKIIQHLYDETKLLVESMQEVLEDVQRILYEQESITKDRVKEIINEHIL
jgi:ATP-dependent metalloprotease FtsH